MFLLYVTDFRGFLIRGLGSHVLDMQPGDRHGYLGDRCHQPVRPGLESRNGVKLPRPRTGGDCPGIAPAIIMGTVGDPRFRGVNFVKVRGRGGLQFITEATSKRSLPCTMTQAAEGKTQEGWIMTIYLTGHGTRLQRAREILVFFLLWNRYVAGRELVNSSRGC